MKPICLILIIYLLVITRQGYNANACIRTCAMRADLYNDSVRGCHNQLLNVSRLIMKLDLDLRC